MDSLFLSPIDMFENAGPVGKAVMAVLLVASLWCWIVIIEGVFAVIKLRRILRAAQAGGVTALTAAIQDAGRQSAKLTIAMETAGERRLRVAEAMARVGRTALARAEGGLPNLAVIASVAPFIGLFGTVWGIMTSFSSIAAAKDTSLAVVAPGIAEALAATAYGLAAAIPASIGYNRIGAAFASVGQGLANFIEESAVEIVAEHSRKEDV